MQIKETKRRSLTAKGSLRAIFFLFSVLVFTVFLVVTVWTVNQVYYQGPEIPQSRITKTLSRTIKAVSHFRFPLLRIMGFNSDFPTIYLDLKHVDYAKLENVADHDSRSHVTESLRRETYVPATLRTNNRSLKAKVRLKGDRKIHWANPGRWSFRVKAKDDTLLGMREFSIQHPVTRNYIYEWLFHEFLKHEGIIGLRYLFVDLYVNGDNKGVYVVEEHFDHRLIENNRRREGPILGFKEDSHDWREASISAYQQRSWEEKNPTLLKKAIRSLSTFQKGESALEETIDAGKLATYLAICDILETPHGSLPKSVKFYFNPVTELLEPIGFDGHFLDKGYPALISELNDFRGESGLWGYGTWYERIFNQDGENNIGFYEAYIREIERLTADGYLEGYFEKIDEELNRNLDFIYSDFPYSDLYSMHPSTGISPFFHFDKTRIYDRRSYVRDRLKLISPLYFKHMVSEGNLLRAIIQNKSTLPVQILDISYEGKLYIPEKEIYLNRTTNHRTSSGEEVVLFLDRNTEAGNINQVGLVRYSIPGKKEISPQKLFYTEASTLHSRSNGNLDDFEFIRSAGHKAITIGPGNLVLEKELVIPQGYHIAVLPGTHIDLVNSARIVAFSPIDIRGKEDDRITITSSDQTGKGIAVLNAGEKSYISDVDFSNQTLASDEDWTLTSTLTFYESDVEISNSTFSSNAAEDVINIIRSDFSIENIVMNDSKSDGIDIDFSNGSISKSSFSNIGNDAIDLSGAIVSLEKIRSDSSGDKGVSIGENSTVVANEIRINKSRIGFAIKDSSYLELKNSSVTDSDIGFVVFRKKHEFLPAKADVWRCASENVSKEYLLEKESTLILDGTSVEANSQDLRDDLYEK